MTRIRTDAAEILLVGLALAILLLGYLFLGADRRVEPTFEPSSGQWPP